MKHVCNRNNIWHVMKKDVVTFQFSKLYYDLKRGGC